MWILKWKGHWRSQAPGIEEAEKQAALLSYVETRTQSPERISPIRINYTNGSYLRKLTGNLFVMMSKEGKQLCLGTAEECEWSLDDPERDKMFFDNDITAEWAESTSGEDG